MRYLPVVLCVCSLVGCWGPRLPTIHGPEPVAQKKSSNPRMPEVQPERPAPERPADNEAKMPADAEAPADTVAMLVDDYVDTGIDGVVDLTSDEDGQIQKIVVVSAIPLGAGLGENEDYTRTRRQAVLRAANLFRAFLKDRVDIHESEAREHTLVLENQDDPKDDKTRVAKDSKRYEPAADDVVRGLRVLGFRTPTLNGGESEFVLVCEWNTRIHAPAVNTDDNEVARVLRSSAPAAKRSFEDE